MKAASNADRTVFLDNLRALMVMLVLIFHSAASYGSGVAFWPIHDSNTSEIIDIFMFLCVFMMAVLFFVAGYFVLLSLMKKGTWEFIKGKLKRLGLPWAIITVLVLPVLDYIHYSQVNGLQYRFRKSMGMGNYLFLLFWAQYADIKNPNKVRQRLRVHGYSTFRFRHYWGAH